MHNRTKGLHLIITGFVDQAHQECLNDEGALRQMLLDAVYLVEMEPLIDPVLLSVPLQESLAKTDDDCGGVTGFVVLSTSHVSIHTWPLHNRLSLDLYSCHDFDHSKVLRFLRERLGVKGGRVVLVDRTPEPALMGRFEIIRVGAEKS